MPKRFEEHFNSDYYRSLAEDALSELDKTEKANWVQHPCTRALLHTLMGDYIDHHNGWEDGMFTGPTADITAQANAKAMGSIEAIRLIAQFIEDIPND